MKPSATKQFQPSAFTLLEMSIVIMVLLSLIGVGLFSSKKIDEWKLARQASETLRSVYSAKRMFLSDNPTRAVTTLTTADLIPYLPNNAVAMPAAKSLTGAALSYKVNDVTATKPPVYFIDGSGVHYDPSGSYTDQLWDVGELNR
jgi:prepilin-type N-terminal cleavage/methylation domain-containing protein